MTAATDFDELTELTIAAAAVAIRSGATTPTELTEAYLDRIQRRNPALNAYVTVSAERARDDARRMTAELAAGLDRGPLHGVPIALKDLVDTSGITTAGGAAVYADRVPEADATIARRLRAAGTVLLGKTNTHELAFGITTMNPHFGPTRNPWDRGRSPGGSSGGSAAALSANLAAGAVGTDTAGSIRIPAAMCGVVGMKPTFGLVPRTGVLGLSTMLDHAGPMGRSVEDVAILLGAMAGYDPGDPASVQLPVPDYRAALATDLAGVRVGVPRSAAWEVLDDDVRSAGEVALDVLRQLGAKVVDVVLPDPSAFVGVPGGVGAFSLMIEESRHAHRRAWAAQPAAFGADLASFYSAPALDARGLLETLDLLGTHAVAVRDALMDVELLASATVPIPAQPIGAETVHLGGQERPLVPVVIANTFAYNVARVPAISVPCGFSAAGMPIGLQLAGRPLGEGSVLRAASAFEAAAGWRDRHPGP